MTGEIKDRLSEAPDRLPDSRCETQAIVSKTAIGGKNLSRSSQMPGLVSKSAIGKKSESAALLDLNMGLSRDV